MKTFIRVYLFILIIISLLLLTIHTFSICNLKVDNVSIFLLIILILIPFITSIKKFKWGEFEAEIGSKDIKEIEDSVNKITSDKSQEKNINPISIEGYTEKEATDLITYLYELSDVDPTLTMAKLRIELEKLIREIYLAHNGDEKRIYSLNFMINYLIKQKDFNSEPIESVRMIIDVCNRVIHGEKIEKSEARMIVELSSQLLEYMTGYTRGLSLFGIMKK